MALRTDLAIEGGGMGGGKKRYRAVNHKERLPFGSRTSTLLKTPEGDSYGRYITYELPPFAASAESTDCLAESLADSLRGMLKGLALPVFFGAVPVSINSTLLFGMPTV